MSEILLKVVLIRIPLSLPAGTDSTLSNNVIQHTAFAESGITSTSSSSGSSCGASISARYAANDEIVGLFHNIVADKSIPTNCLASRRTVIAIIESSPNSGNG